MAWVWPQTRTGDECFISPYMRTRHCKDKLKWRTIFIFQQHVCWRIPSHLSWLFVAPLPSRPPPPPPFSAVGQDESPLGTGSPRSANISVLTTASSSSYAGREGGREKWTTYGDNRSGERGGEAAKRRRTGGGDGGGWEDGKKAASKKVKKRSCGEQQQLERSKQYGKYDEKEL